MPISINNPESEALAHELARLTGEPLTSAIQVALAEHLRPTLHASPTAIAECCASRPILAILTEAQILGYDEFGAPTR